MTASSLRSTQPLHDGVRDTVEKAIASLGGRVTWRDSERMARTYGLIELPDGAPAVRAVVREPVTVFEVPIIALAVSPTVPEAIPALLEAFGGAGRPQGMLACEKIGDAVLLEWDPGRTAVVLMMTLLDAELARFASGRTVELLAPLPPELVARIAADGLSTPEIGSERILETLVERVRSS